MQTPILQLYTFKIVCHVSANDHNVKYRQTVALIRISVILHVLRESPSVRSKRVR